MRNRSFSDARWFYGKKRKIGMGSLYLTESRLSWNEMCCASQLYVSHMCKRIFQFEPQLSSYWQNIKFSRYCPKFHIFTKIVIFQVYLHLFRPTASSLLISWQDMSVILFFVFASCEPLSSGIYPPEKKISNQNSVQKPVWLHGNEEWMGYLFKLHWPLTPTRYA